MKKEKSDKNQIGTEAEISNPTQNEKRRTRSPEEFKSLMNRLCRIEGQIKGIKKML